MRKRTPSKVLNESQGFVGLTSDDLVALTVISSLGVMPFMFFGYPIYAYPFVFILWFVVIVVRQTHRRKIFRDFYKYITKSKVVNVPRNN